MDSTPTARSPEADAQRRQWDLVAAGWARWWPTIEKAGASVSRKMLDLAHVGPGHRVLDIATGYGEPAMMAAHRVGPAGRVVATDISTGMLEIARGRATLSGTTNVEFRQVDAGRLEIPDGSFDAVLCRWGVTSLPDTANVLLAIRRMLAPGGSFVTAVWNDGAEGRPLATLATALAQEMFGVPEEATSVPMCAGRAEYAMADTLRQAGFIDVRVEQTALMLEWASAEACMHYMLDVSPDLAALFLDRPSAHRAEYGQRLVAGLLPWVGADGKVRACNTAILASAKRGSENISV
jgi:ubiquinone/menaquinone biosynthesis C-methylase UbiE